VSFDVAAGEVLGILGPNGSGKSTLIRVLAGLMKPSSGLATVQGTNIGRVGLVPQNFQESFFPSCSLITNLAIANGLTRKETKSRAEKALSTLRLSLSLDVRPGSCSGGMLQQAAIIRALCSSSSLILADEPFSALDASAVLSVRYGIRSIVRNEGKVLLIVLHSLEDAVSICDRVLVVPPAPYCIVPTPGCSQADFIENERARNDPELEFVPSFSELAKVVLMEGPSL
jgi:ABC-type multidrug transport system ATPase subunit